MSQVKIPAHTQFNAMTEESFWDLYRGVLSDINKATIHSLATTILDQDSNVFSAEYLTFFKDTLLSDIEFENVDSNPFYIKNKNNNNRLSFSNRYTVNELRGPEFRKFLSDMAKTNPSMSLSNALLYSITEPTNSDLHKYFLASSLLIDLDVMTKAILIKSSRIALSRLSQGESLTNEDLKSIFDKQYEYFHNCPAVLQPVYTQLKTTTTILEKLLNEAIEKKDNSEHSNSQLDEIIAQLRSAIHAACDLMPDFDENGVFSYPANYQSRVNNYSVAATVLANNKNLKQFSFSSYVGISMFALGLIALATCAAVVVFPPSALFLSQALLHGIVSVTAIEGTLAGAGVVAAGAGIGFFKTGGKFHGKDVMDSLQSSIEKTDKNISAITV